MPKYTLQKVPSKGNPCSIESNQNLEPCRPKTPPFVNAPRTLIATIKSTLENKKMKDESA